METTRSRLQHWLLAWAGSAPPVAEPEPAVASVDAIRCAMVRTMRGCSDRHRARAADLVMHAVDAQALWLVRGDLYQSLARELGEREATRRIGGLQPLFRGHVDAVELARWDRSHARASLH